MVEPKDVIPSHSYPPIFHYDSDSTISVDVRDVNHSQIINVAKINWLNEFLAEKVEDVEYCFRVRGLADDCPPGPWSIGTVEACAEISGSTSSGCPEEAPWVKIISAEPDPGGMIIINVGWDAVPNATSYNIYWKDSPGVTKVNGKKISNVKNPHTIKGLNPGTYYFVVTAVNDLGESAESEEFSISVD